MFSQFFGNYLLNEGLVTPTQLTDAIQDVNRLHTRIGELAVRYGYLTPEQVEQIHVTPKQEIVLVPRIGNHIIEIGKADNLEKKLAKLEEFYKEGLNKVGWNKYNKINIEFDKQVICTKKD